MHCKDTQETLENPGNQKQESKREQASMSDERMKREERRSRANTKQVALDEVLAHVESVFVRASAKLSTRQIDCRQRERAQKRCMRVDQPLLAST